MKAKELMMTQSLGGMADGSHCVWAKGSADYRAAERGGSANQRGRKQLKSGAVVEVTARGCLSRRNNANPDPLLLIVTLTKPTYLH